MDTNRYDQARRILERNIEAGIDALLSLVQEADPYDHQVYDAVELDLSEGLTRDHVPYLKNKALGMPDLTWYIERVCNTIEKSSRSGPSA